MSGTIQKLDGADTFYSIFFCFRRKKGKVISQWLTNHSFHTIITFFIIERKISFVTVVTRAMSIIDFFCVRMTMVAACAVLLAGCAGARAHKGAVIDPQLASSIQAGVDNKASVAKTLGRPTFTGEFTPNDWYYVSRDTTQSPSAIRASRADRAPRPLRRRRATSPRSNSTGKELVANSTRRSQDPDARPQAQLLRRVFGNIGTVSTPGCPAAGDGPAASKLPRFLAPCLCLSARHDRDARRHDLCRLSAARPAARRPAAAVRPAR